MSTKEMTKGMQLREGIDPGHAALTMAVGIVVDRVQRLPEEDRQDLYELLKGLTSAENREEVASIAVAMMEILDQDRCQVREMEIPDQPEDGLEKWLDFVSSKICELRQAAGLTQEELAEKSGLPQSHISRLENAKHSPSRGTLEKIAAALGISLSKLDPSA